MARFCSWQEPRTRRRADSRATGAQQLRFGLSRKTVSMTTTEVTHDASRILQLNHVVVSLVTHCMHGRLSHVRLLALGTLEVGR